MRWLNGRVCPQTLFTWSLFTILISPLTAIAEMAKIQHDVGCSTEDKFALSLEQTVDHFSKELKDAEKGTTNEYELLIHSIYGRHPAIKDSQKQTISRATLLHFSSDEMTEIGSWNIDEYIPESPDPNGPRARFVTKQGNQVVFDLQATEHTKSGKARATLTAIINPTSKKNKKTIKLNLFCADLRVYVGATSVEAAGANK